VNNLLSFTLPEHEKIIIAALSIIVATNLKNTKGEYSSDKIKPEILQIIKDIPPFPSQPFWFSLFQKQDDAQKLNTLFIQYLYVISSIMKKVSLFNLTLNHIIKSGYFFNHACTIDPHRIIDATLDSLYKIVQNTFIMVDKQMYFLESKTSSAVFDQNKRPLRSIISYIKNLVDILITAYQSNQSWGFHNNKADRNTILHDALSSIFDYSIDQYAHLVLSEYEQHKILNNIIEIILICGAENFINEQNRYDQTPLDCFLMRWEQHSEIRPYTNYAKALTSLTVIIQTLKRYGAETNQPELFKKINDLCSHPEKLRRTFI
jgi:hypothetical protein